MKKLMSRATENFWLFCIQWKSTASIKTKGAYFKVRYAINRFIWQELSFSDLESLYIIKYEKSTILNHNEFI